MNKKFDWTQEAVEVAKLVTDGSGIYEACQKRGFSYTAFSKGVEKETLKQIKSLKTDRVKAARKERAKLKRLERKQATAV